MTTKKPPKKIALDKGLFALVDAEDYPVVSRFSWFAKKAPRTFYAARTARTVRRKNRFMHCHLLGFTGIDHINGNGLDNRRQNLRKATSSQNNANRQPNKGRQYKGTHKVSPNCFEARITKQGKPYYLGTFKTEKEAARAYNEAAKSLFGDFARLNVL